MQRAVQPRIDDRLHPASVLLDQIADAEKHAAAPQRR